MTRMITTDIVDIDQYAQAVNNYNDTPINKRSEWSTNGVFDNPTLLSIDNNGENSVEYVLEAVPEWTNDQDEIGYSDKEDKKLADEFYFETTDKEAPKDLYKQNLHLIVVEYNYDEAYSQAMDYSDFVDIAKGLGVNNFKKLTIKTNEFSK